MSRRAPRIPRLLRLALALGALICWGPATAFFAILGARVAGRASAAVGPIADLRAALITVAYSLGGAAIGLGLAWSALSRGRARALARWGMLWLGVTAMLLVTRRVSGWPLLIASVVAFVIGIDVCRRLVLEVFAVERGADR